MADPFYHVGIEFVSGSFTDVTADVRNFTVARDLGFLLSNMTPGAAQFTLDNFDGKYSPDNTSSPFTGLMRPGLPIRVLVGEAVVLDDPTFDTASTWASGANVWAAQSGFAVASSVVAADSIFTQVKTDLTSGALMYTRFDVTSFNHGHGRAFTGGVTHSVFSGNGTFQNLFLTTASSVSNGPQILADSANWIIDNFYVAHPVHHLFTGTVDEWNVDPDIGAQRQVTLEARDELKTLRNRIITTSLFTNYNVSSLFTEVVTHAAVNTFAIDAMTDELPFAWFRETTAWDAMRELLRSGFYFTYVAGDGELRVKERYYDQLQTVVASFEEFFELQWTIADDQVYNEIVVEGTPREQDTVTNTVAFIPDAIFIPSSSWVSFSLEYLDPENGEPAPATGMVTPVNSSDYLTNTASDGTGTDRTATTSADVTFFGQTAVNTIFNGHGDEVWLHKYQLRGDPVHRRARFTATADDPTSSEVVYGRRTFTVANDLIGSQLFARDYAIALRDRQKNPVAAMQMTLRNEFPDLLQFELGDLVHIVNTFTGVASDQTIAGITHSVTLADGLVHNTQIDLDRFRDQELLILDNDPLGELDARRLGF